MRLCVLDGRSTLLTAEGEVDVETASGGRFSRDVARLYTEWTVFRLWADGFEDAPGDAQPELDRLGALSPSPSQVLAIGLNYVDHAAESGFAVPEVPIVFTKFPSSVAGPGEDVRLTGDEVDWEIEIVAVIGTGGRSIPAERAWEAIAGLTIGQDYSDRAVQFAGAPVQFSLGKSFAGFAPIGPVLVTPDALPDPAEVVLECAVAGEIMQRAPLADLILPIPALIEFLSDVVELRPGDLVFTGTPPGVGFGREPRRYLAAGETVRSSATGIGWMSQTFR
ncbi:fumarylacetoacetate hydrolase family protein [Microbacterium tenebrionis]|uniref:fumarylacetoacetate hydrolase family protein n=1 Tax=Microbacterium tenebrionis TaxID=2830665 RepID=UPI00158C3E67|nr:fumarylacetoacetate hydrolase family protein [Microbacterium ihumii]